MLVKGGNGVKFGLPLPWTYRRRRQHWNICGWQWRQLHRLDHRQIPYGIYHMAPANRLVTIYWQRVVSRQANRSVKHDHSNELTRVPASYHQSQWSSAKQTVASYWCSQPPCQEGNQLRKDPSHWIRWQQYVLRRNETCAVEPKFYASHNNITICTVYPVEYTYYIVVLCSMFAISELLSFSDNFF